LWFTELSSTELYNATLACLQLGTYQQLNLSCANDSLIYVTDVRHGHLDKSQHVSCLPEMTSTSSSWCVNGPPYNDMVLIQCNSKTHCTVDTAEMSSVMYTCHDQVTDVIQASYRCLPGTRQLIALMIVTLHDGWEDYPRTVLAYNVYRKNCSQ